MAIVASHQVQNLVRGIQQLCLLGEEIAARRQEGEKNCV